jgi:hypothetical protein
MSNITYSIGDVNFDAVPRKGNRTLDISSRSHVSLGRKRLIAISPPGERVLLAGDYLIESTRASLEALITQTETSGTKHTFDNGETQYHAIIERFSCEAIVGITETAYSFEMDLLLLGELEE